jgi:ATP-binding protein involved in chromosome partitioning
MTQDELAQEVTAFLELPEGSPLFTVSNSRPASVTLHFAAARKAADLASHLQAQFGRDWGQVSVQLESKHGEAMPGVRHIILVASGKGGVGKSTTTAHLGRALQHNGLRVGILDADIYGPSVPLMFAQPDGTRPELTPDKRFIPVEVDGIQTMSIGYLTTEKTPAVWRGPMASGALLQMIQNTAWDDVDVLLVDMPPGTGDIQLSIAQKTNVSGAVVVTTPQDIALIDALKAVEMFQKVSIPVLGVIENMSVHICSECGHTEALFGENGGMKLASDYDLSLLGQLPLSLAIREKTDRGDSLLREETELEALLYDQVAEAMTRELCLNDARGDQAPVISMS